MMNLKMKNHFKIKKNKKKETSSSNAKNPIQKRENYKTKIFIAANYQDYLVLSTSP